MKQREVLVDKIIHPQKTIHIALAGKYTHLTDSYMSVIEALQHAGVHNDVGVKVDLLDMEQFESDDREQKLNEYIKENNIA